MLCGMQVLFGFVISGTVRLGIIMVSLLRYRQIVVAGLILEQWDFGSAQCARFHLLDRLID